MQEHNSQSASVSVVQHLSDKVKNRAPQALWKHPLSHQTQHKIESAWNSHPNQELMVALAIEL